MSQHFNWSKLRDHCVDFAQRLIQVPSMPGQEADVARIIALEMEDLDFDDVWFDSVGNVFGRINGHDRQQKALLLNSHTDHVDPGEILLWDSPPFAAEIRGGRIFGRAACDIKGPLAVQIYSMAALIRAGERPRRDVVFSGFVQEEVGGLGAVHWVNNRDFPVALVLLGEPSSNQLSLGHRGVIQFWVTFHGRSVHASSPNEGINPNLAMSQFLQRLNETGPLMETHRLLGDTTITPTIVEVDTKSMNVTPAWTRILLDIRTAVESPNSLLELLKRVGQDLDCDLTFGDAWAEEPGTPPPYSDETIFGFYTDPDSEEVRKVADAVSAGTGRQPQLVNYRFATDGRHMASEGFPILGYSPGEEALAHTANESISITMMAESLRGHFEILRSF